MCEHGVERSDTGFINLGFGTTYMHEGARQKGFITRSVMGSNIKILSFCILKT